MKDSFATPARDYTPGMGEAVAHRTYSRLKDDGTRETWADVANRVALGNSLLDPRSKAAKMQEFHALHHHLRQASTIMAGRHLQHGDKTQPTRNMEVFTNCGRGDTEILTQEFGVTTLKEVAGRVVTVRCDDGQWRPATAKSYGEQRLYRLAFQRCGTGPRTTREVYFTRNHRWLLEDGTVTDNIDLGAVLKVLPVEQGLDPVAVVHGLVFGDGSAHKRRLDHKNVVKSQGRTYATIRVCKEDAVQEGIHRVLDEVGYTYTTPEYAEGDRVYYIGKFEHSKDLPHTRDGGYIAGFIRGWWLADGHKTEPNGTVTISTADEVAADWLVRHAAFVGLTVVSHTLRRRAIDDGSFANGKTLHIVRLRADVRWKLVEIAEQEMETVYCVEEPVTKSFTLANGLVTGNCSTSAATFLTFYLLLNGSGVGRAYDDEMIVVDFNFMPIVVPVIDMEHKDRKSREIGVLTHEQAGHLYMGAKQDYFRVPDSREGWAKAVEYIETMTFAMNQRDTVLIIDFSDVRPRGSPINGMQQRPASGPGPLISAISNLARLRDAKMESWRAAMYADHYMGECVLVGGARRAARMSTKTWRDRNVLDFIGLKKGGFLWSSNNSVTVDDEFWKAVRFVEGMQQYPVGTRYLETWIEHGQITELQAHAYRVFQAICQHCYHDRTGEPGFINVDKLVQNDEGLGRLMRGDFAESVKYKLDEAGKELMAFIARRFGKMKHKMIVNPCGEVALSKLGAYCIIADVVPFHAQLDPFERQAKDANEFWDNDAEDAFRVTTRALIRVNLMDSLYKKEVERTNRIGVGITGIHEYAWARFGYGFRDLIDEVKSQDFWQMLAHFKRAVVDEAASYSKALGLVVPHTNTTLKPSGTVSKIFGLTEAAHLPAMREYMRWVQFRNGDPLIAVYEAKGYPVRKLEVYGGTTIVGFPTRPTICTLGMGDKLVTAAEATPAEQYQWIRLLEKYWIRGVDEAGQPLEVDTGNQVSYCLAGGRRHLVPTSKGMQRIESIVAAQTNDRAGNAQEIIDLVDNGVKPTIVMTMANGASITGTVDHRVLTVDSDSLAFTWRRLGDMTGGETVVRRVGDNLWPSEALALPPLVNGRTDGRNGHFKEVTAPTHVTPEFALFLGMLLSDGSISENGIALTTVDQSVAGIYRSVVGNLFGIECSVGRDKRSERILVVQGNSRALVRWLKEVGISDSHDDHFVPECILRATRECVEQFVRGYTLDGYAVGQGHKAVVCSTVSKTMATDLCALMWNMGFDVSLGFKKGRRFMFNERNKGQGKDQWQVVVPASQSKRFVTEIGFMEQHKTNAILDDTHFFRAVGHWNNTVPKKWFMNHYTEHRGSYSAGGLRSVMKAKTDRISMMAVKGYFGDLSEVQHLLDPHLRFTQVREVAPGPTVGTYDITVDVSHEYVANGVVVHNTLKYNPKIVSYDDFKRAIIENQPTIRCCSVMPQEDKSAYEYLPEQPVSKQEFELIASAIRAVEREDIGLEHLDCAKGACPVDFRTEKQVA